MQILNRSWLEAHAKFLALIGGYPPATGSGSSSASKLTVNQDGSPVCQHRYLKYVYTFVPGKQFYGPQDGVLTCDSCGEEVRMEGW